MIRFVAPKWALLGTLGVDLATMNAVGVVRAIIGLLKLPPHAATEDSKATAA